MHYCTCTCSHIVIRVCAVQCIYMYMYLQFLSVDIRYHRAIIDHIVHDWLSEYGVVHLIVAPV